jgi:hypothetical protein
MSSAYEQDLEPLLDCIAIIFQTELLVFIKIELQKYKEEFLTNESSKHDFTPSIKAAVKHSLALLSKDYIAHLMHHYFSEEGLTLFVFSKLYNLTTEYIE